MTVSQFFILLSVIYIAPYIGAKLAVRLSGVILLAAIAAFGVEVFNDLR